MPALALRTILTTALIIMTIVFLAPDFAHSYYGRHSTEAILRFEAIADVPIANSVKLENLNSRTPERKKALERVGAQVQHLMGTFQSESFNSDFGFKGTLGENSLIKFTGMRPAKKQGRKLLSYEFKGRVVFQKEAFHGHESRRVAIKLPLAPDLVYGLGMIKTRDGRRNACTDRVFNEEIDFWYYWDPDQDGCPLQGNSSDVFRSWGVIERLPNTVNSYPEYDRLFGDNGNGDELDIAVLIGFIRAQNPDARKPNRRDEAFAAYRALDEEMKRRGFELVEKKSRFRVLKNGTLVEGINTLRRYAKKVKTQQGEILVRVFGLLADTDIDSEDATFRHYLPQVMRHADMLIYDGHSNLGRNLDLTILREVRPDPKKYQILFFNGCSTYPYLNGMYFQAKGGSKSVDIITAGLPALASASGPNLVAFLSSFLDGKTLSYQRILSALEKSNGDDETFLVGVKGDEDNQWHP